MGEFSRLTRCESANACKRRELPLRDFGKVCKLSAELHRFQFSRQNPRVISMNANLSRICISTAAVACVCLVTSTVTGQMLQPATQVQSTQTSGTRAGAVTDARITAAYNAASASLAAFRENDFEAFANLTHEKIIEDGGGREQLIALTQQAKEILAIQTEGYDSQVHPPQQIIESGQESYAIVPQTVSIELKSKQQLDRRSYLFGISSDNGRSWKFVDGSAGAQKIRELFPGFPANQRLPDEPVR